MAEQPMPKSPPGYIDLYAKRRHQAKLQVLEREIDFLQEELKSLEKVQPTSRCCEEINDFVAAKPDPFVAEYQKSNSNQSGCSCSWRRISGCCRSDKEHQQQARKKHCCLRENCCPKCCCGFKGCSCFSQKCCLLKLCSSNCCKAKLCSNCVLDCCCSCCQ
ncbi:guanine nucleotide-binding protein subunit gamma 3 isoform X2 [Beta vulgaris subsp. vulgaris]|uniref:guanine nucleotide-binding protein subunit gamma 3 isoform X2 n=1 Tax=Beta vulgaris subsp. vulgaris TaxID=3555 RepID=UPI00053FC8C8|nr:guanine nucleotide-binding protein subunit gamma 3 isoform X2 [Beta vulgaris subsp. vulgaris]